MHFVDLNAITPMCSKKDMTVDQLLITKVFIIHMKIRTSEAALDNNVKSVFEKVK